MTAIQKCALLILARARKQGLNKEVVAAADELKRNVFHWAALACSTNVMSLLLSSCRWDPQTLRVKDLNGKSVLDYAQQRYNPEVLYLLQQAVAPPILAQAPLRDSSEVVVAGNWHDAYWIDDP